MRSKILSYTLVFFLLILLFSQISQIYEKSYIKNVEYESGEIEDFILTGINTDKYVMSGKRIREQNNKFLIDGFNLSYIKGDENVFIKAKKGIYRTDKDILDLIGDVKIISKDLSIDTQVLKIFVKERRAFNTEPVKLYSQNMETYGNNIFINLKTELLKLENVKTVYRGM
ncbi:LPS export ABC transporter protein LptC [Persephonella hydrogeniphila]|uniref:LPS export ABC transporter protein LptC n=1 Tax=Persephonella hydrogeniphila TaxID=198703 RepID=A0A285MY47_9AQUI|nr:LPS export ABC transporter periplasmic protein LptC [Persephonella hydrogeniphila]SNZ02129.1 LPS export ABC transporter protein LptC [Persephonella hydrogeniphila]